VSEQGRTIAPADARDQSLTDLVIGYSIVQSTGVIGLTVMMGHVPTRLAWRLYQ
jgi:hypothetical protein